MKSISVIVPVLASGLVLAPYLRTQSQPQSKSPGSDQSTQPAGAQSPSRPQQQSNQNPFPEDTSSVPVLSAHDTADLPPSNDAAKDAIPMPADDIDPVRSPEQARMAAEGGEQTSSSSLAGMGSLLPGPDEDTQSSKRNKKGAQIAPEHQETAAEDEEVGNYYLDNKNWKAALSRFQSALVLDPDNPDVYWGLAESQRHIGDMAAARANYQKVVEYDPDSRHGKDARKLLKEPEIANARPAAAPAP